MPNDDLSLAERVLSGLVGDSSTPWPLYQLTLVVIDLCSRLDDAEEILSLHDAAAPELEKKISILKNQYSELLYHVKAQKND